MTPSSDPQDVDPEGRAGATVLALITNFAEWVHRRVESVTLLDDVTIRRDVSIDFTVPQDGGDFGETNELPWVPLTLLEKELLRNFDLRDAAGRPVPMLTRAENSIFASRALLASARAVLDVPRIPSSVRQELIDLVGKDTADAEALIAAWRARPNVSHETDDKAWNALLRSEGFLALATTLASNFVLFAVTPAEPGHRQILKFSYEERYDNERRPIDGRAFIALAHATLQVGLDRSRNWSFENARVQWQPPEEGPPPPNVVFEDWKGRTAATFGWRVYPVVLSMPGANLASSFHVEVPAPQDMEIDSAQLRFNRRPGGGETDDGSWDSADGILIQRAHLYASQVPTDLEGEAVVHLRARRQGFLRSSVSIGWLTAILLWAGYAFFDDLTRSTNSQTAAALLLIVTTLLNSSLIRPGEHRLVGRVLLGVRFLLALGICCTFIAVGVLAGVGGRDRAAIWLAASILDTLVAGLLAFSYRLPRPLDGLETPEP